MPRRRPTAVTVIAVLHFVFAAFSLCGVLGNVLSKLVTDLGGTGGGPQAEMQRRILEASEQIPGYQAIYITQLVVGAAVVVVLVVAGVGLLQLKPWARVLSVAYAVWAIVSGLFGAVFFFVAVQPALDPIYQEMERINPAMGKFAQLGQVVAAVSVIVGVFIQLAYATAILIVMFLPSVRKAFRAGPPGEGEEDEGAEDYYDDRYER